MPNLVAGFSGLAFGAGGVFCRANAQTMLTGSRTGMAGSTTARDKVQVMSANPHLAPRLRFRKLGAGRCPICWIPLFGPMLGSRWCGVRWKSAARAPPAGHHDLRVACFQTRSDYIAWRGAAMAVVLDFIAKSSRFGFRSSLSFRLKGAGRIARRALSMQTLPGRQGWPRTRVPVRRWTAGRGR